MNATTHDTTPARDEPNIDGTSGSRAGQFGAGARIATAAAMTDVGAQASIGVAARDLHLPTVRAESRCSVGAAKGRVAELRSLLRYLFMAGLTQLPLAAAVPPVAGWHDTGLPTSLSASDVQALLDNCDRSTPTGVRDFAIVMLLARLGLRSVEVARLELTDVDWRSGEVAIRGKARRRDRLPLPVEAGEAIAAYLVDARPRTEHRHLFLTCRAPRRGIRPDLVGDVVGRACQRAGLPPVGAHRLRHALATGLLAKGVILADISQVLRHRDPATTAIYAKVDMISLRAVALPWPGAQQ
jgi:integrase